MSSIKFKRPFLGHSLRQNVIRENVVIENVVRRNDVEDNVDLGVDDVDGDVADGSRRPVGDGMSDFWASQCQKYEERIVELHSVIAELTRKLEETNDVIREESEFDETSVVTDSCLEDDEDDHEGVQEIKTSKPVYRSWTLQFQKPFTSAKNKQK